MLQNEPLVAIVAVHTAENEPLKVLRVISLIFSIHSLGFARHGPVLGWDGRLCLSEAKRLILWPHLLGRDLFRDFWMRATVALQAVSSPHVFQEGFLEEFVA